MASALCCVTLLRASELRAQPAGPILLAYDAPESCPAAADFQRGVQRRLPSVRFVDEGTHERELSIALRSDGSFTNGELRLLEADGSLRQRNVRFTSCAEAVEGMALIAAVSLNPQAALAPVPAEPPSVAPAPPTVPPAAPPPPPARPVQVDTASARWGLGAELTGTFGAFPAAAPGAVLFADWAPGSPRIVSPLLRVAFAHSQRRGIEVGTAQASFALTQGSLSLCPLRFAVARAELRPCAFFSGGSLHAWGAQTEDPQARALQYWAWGGSASFAAQVGEAMDMVLDLALTAPLLRDRYVLEQAEFWRTPTSYVSVGVGVRWLVR